jgi:ubiquinone/menaquinone biosynthesis C-methylase UbiE
MSFDYSGTMWAPEKVRLAPYYLQALKLRWCLKDLTGVKGRVLDLGCGIGGVPKAIKHYRPDLEVIGCDISKKAISYARKNPEGVEFILADACKLPFKKDSLAAVVSFDVLEHLENIEAALSEVFRVLKPKGLFHNFIPLEDQIGTFYWLLSKLGWNSKTWVGHVHVYNAKKIVLLLEKNGFKVMDKKYGYHWLFQLLHLLHYGSWVLLKKRPVGEKSFSKLKMVVAPLVNLESLLLVKVPGGGVSLKMIKKE